MAPRHPHRLSVVVVEALRVTGRSIGSRGPAVLRYPEGVVTPSGRDVARYGGIGILATTSCGRVTRPREPAG